MVIGMLFLNNILPGFIGRLRSYTRYCVGKQNAIAIGISQQKFLCC